MKWIFAILLLGIIVFIHEAGHFLVAKMNGVAVEEFSIGFGPRIASTERGGTTYSLKILPFGGSCALKGLIEIPEEGEVTSKEEDSFGAKTIPQRAAILFAGPFFNFLLAFVAAVIMISIAGYDPTTVTSVDENAPAHKSGLLSGDVVKKINGKRMVIGRDVDAYFTYRTLAQGETLTVEVDRDGTPMVFSFPVASEDRYMMGISYYPDESEAQLTDVAKGSAAEAAGLYVGDVIRSVNGTAIDSGEALSRYMDKNPPATSQIHIVYERNGKTKETALTPTMTNYVTPGFSCFAPRKAAPAYRVVRYAVTEVRFWIGAVIKSIGMLFSGQAGVKDLSGPVGIATVISDAYEESSSISLKMLFINMLYLLVLLSANLGVMNLLPLPALDGGRLLLLVPEAVTGHKVSAKVEGAINFAGMAFLMALMVFVMFNDIVRLF